MHGGDQGRSKVLETAKILGDQTITSLSPVDFSTARYHSKDCYGPYILKGKRKRESQDTVVENTNEEELLAGPSTSRSSKRRKTSSLRKKEKLCVVCGSRTLFKSKHDLSCDLFRICTVGRARKLINAAALFQDVVFDRISVHQDESAIFAADILAHKDCIKKYIKRYDDHIEKILYNLELEANVASDSDDIVQAFEQVVNTLDIEHIGYTLSTIRDKINSILGDEGVHVTNRQVKSMLIERYKERIVFTYPEMKRSSQMFFGNNIQAIEIAETLKKCDLESVKTIASKIKEEMKAYDFALDQSFCSSNDVLISSNKLSQLMSETGTFDAWNTFTQCLFKPKNMNTDANKVMKETLFQIVYYIYHNGAKVTPFHLALAETIHTMTRSKHLITILNKRKLCVSYDTLERIDVGLGQKVISDLPLGHRVPLDKLKLSQDYPINGAMDNFDSADSHDTILILFQNVKNQSSRSHRKKSSDRK